MITITIRGNVALMVLGALENMLPKDVELPAEDLVFKVETLGSEKPLFEIVVENPVS